MTLPKMSEHTMKTASYVNAYVVHQSEWGNCNTIGFKAWLHVSYPSAEIQIAKNWNEQVQLFQLPQYSQTVKYVDVP